MPVAMPDGTRRGRLWLWLAHRMAWVWLAMFAAVISQGVIAGTAWGVVVDLAVWAALLALIAAHRHHGLTMCPRCAADMPVDGERQAERKSRSLRAMHHLWDHRTRWLMAIFGTWGVLVFLVPPWRTVSASVLIYFPLAANDWLFANHRRLTPWCPQCRWPDGGSPEVVPEPVPPSIQRTR